MLTPTNPLIVTGPFGPTLGPARVAAALARGLESGGLATPDLCPLPEGLGSGVLLSGANNRQTRSRRIAITP